MSSNLDAIFNLGSAGFSQAAADVYAARAQDASETRSKAADDFIRGEFGQLMRCVGRVGVLAHRSLMAVHYTAGYLLRADDYTLQKAGRSWALVGSSILRKSLCPIQFALVAIGSIGQLIKPSLGLRIHQLVHQIDYAWDALDCDLNWDSCGKALSETEKDEVNRWAHRIFSTENTEEILQRASEIGVTHKVLAAYSKEQSKNHDLSWDQFVDNYQEGQYPEASAPKQKKSPSLLIPLKNAWNNYWNKEEADTAQVELKEPLLKNADMGAAAAGQSDTRASAPPDYIPPVPSDPLPARDESLQGKDWVYPSTEVSEDDRRMDEALGLDILGNRRPSHPMPPMYA